jgi:2-C-methyl-D-erythritol 4-phosphate cytidylyltransferase
MDRNKVCAIILAGGMGVRFHGKKQFVEFHGIPLYKHIFNTMCKSLQKENIVVVGVDIEGGSTRCGSVFNGLKYFKDRNMEKVLICEAARCLVTTKQIEEIIETEAPSLAFVKPVVDTIILADKTYLNRKECLSLVSPQAFDYNKLLNAYSGYVNTSVVTDDTRIMNEAYGVEPTFLEGDENLFKVTYPKDIVVLEYLYQHIDDFK